jgi:hypothetical protein
MSWWRNIITGADNETVAIGRAIGVVVALVFLVVLPLAAWWTIRHGTIAAADWGIIFDKLTIYVPAIAGAIAMLVGLTAYSEPKGGQP